MFNDFTIPADLQFADLKLARDLTTGDLLCDLAPIEKICAASSIDVNEFFDPYGHNVTELIITWYLQHQVRGGKLDPVLELIFSEGVEEAQEGRISPAPIMKQKKEINLIETTHSQGTA